MIQSRSSVQIWTLSLVVGLILLAIPPAARSQGNAEQSRTENRESLKQFLRTFDTDHSTRYELAFAELSGGGTRQAIVYLLGDKWCGSGGCNLLVLTPAGDSWRIVANVRITNPPIYVLPQKFNGWHSIGVWVQGGGVEHGYLAELRFNGKRYPQNPSRPPAQRLKGKPTGDAVIPSTNGSEALWD